MTDDDVLAAVGPRLRELRTKSGVTLTRLAETTGISVSTLSRLESGQRRPTLELLLPLARAHGVTVDELVGVRSTPDPRVVAQPFEKGGHMFWPLTRRPGGVQAYKQVIPPHHPPGEHKTHEGHEWMYVLSGRVRLLLGEHDLELRAGEVAEFDTRTPHGVGNPGDVPAEILNLYGPQGERIHVRARQGAR